MGGERCRRVCSKPRRRSPNEVQYTLGFTCECRPVGRGHRSSAEVARLDPTASRPVPGDAGGGSERRAGSDRKIEPTSRGRSGPRNLETAKSLLWRSSRRRSNGSRPSRSSANDSHEVRWVSWSSTVRTARRRNRPSTSETIRRTIRPSFDAMGVAGASVIGRPGVWSA
jgi:hypothetical protein